MVVHADLKKKRFEENLIVKIYTSEILVAQHSK